MFFLVDQTKLHQCHNCGKKETELDEASKKLLQCARCKTAKYCSKACQKTEWPTHETGCNANQKMFTLEHSKRVALHKLMVYATKKRDVFASLGVDAFSLGDNPESPLGSVLQITGKFLPSNDSAGDAFIAVGVRLRKFDLLKNDSELSVVAYQRFREHADASRGMGGAVTVELVDEESGLTVIMTVGYGPESTKVRGNYSWRLDLIRKLNEEAYDTKFPMDSAVHAGLLKAMFESLPFLKLN